MKLISRQYLANITGFFTVFVFAEFYDQLLFEKQLLRPHEGNVQPA